MSQYSNELVRGTLKTLILKVLSDHQRMYGYQLIKEFNKKTDHKIQLTEGALYPLLHQLERDNLVTIEKVVADNRERKYYSLNETGKKLSTQKTVELLDFMKTIVSFIRSDT